MIEGRADLRRYAAALMLCLTVGAPGVPVAVAQEPPAQAAPAASAPSSEHKPGFLEHLGRFLDESVAAVGHRLKSALALAKDHADTKGAVDAAVGVASRAAETASTVVKGAADTAGAVGRLGAARVVSGRERCMIAPNGAPDCWAAAQALCKANGFASGSSVDSQTSERCPIFAAEDGAAGACTIEHTVTRALCH